MGTATTSTGDRLTLWRALRVATGPDPTPRATRRVVRHCHQIARATLRQQQRTGSLREDVLGEDVSDLAIDAIAELFERDNQGRFLELREYFDGHLAAGRSEQEVEEKLRRLVQSAVTDWLFEAYRAADRSLSNQLRCLKRAVGRRGDARLQHRGSVQWLEVGGVEEDVRQSEGHPRTPGRPMPLETLESHLTSAVAEATSTGDLLAAAIDVLRAHPDYEAAYPLTRLAQAMRSARARVKSVTDHPGQTTYPDRPLLKPEEIRGHVEEVLSFLREEKCPTYVGQGKVSEETYQAYFQGLEDRLEAQFVPPGDLEMTHYEALSGHLSSLGKEEYRETHRSRFEYLYQQAQETLADQLREVVRP
jgi:hypothetical protein